MAEWRCIFYFEGNISLIRRLLPLTIQEAPMQLVNTVVHRRTPNDVVEFVGEGGEAISVTMKPKESKDDAALVETAKLLMVQLVAFDGPVVEDAAKDQDIYTFEYQDKGIVRVMPGISLPSRQAVEDEVKRSAEDLWRDALDRAEAPLGWAVRARNSNGDIVASCSYEELQLRDA
jgi:hypothetical protein